MVATVSEQTVEALDRPSASAPVRPRRRRRAPRAATPARRRPASAPAREMTVASTLAVALMLVSGVLLLFGAYLFVGSSLAQHRHQDIAYARMKKDLALATVPVGGPIAVGTPVGIVSVPAIGLEQVFEVGSSSAETLDGPGLRPDTVLPGQAGVSVLVGRRAGGGAPFAHLDRLRPGDRIEVVTGQGRFTYVVDVVRTTDAADTRIQQVPSRLTLTTSDPAITNTRSLQVSAALEGKALPAATGSAAGAVAAPADQTGAKDSDHLVALLLWSQALLLAGGTVTWAAVRLQRPAVWLGGVPLLLALLWQVFENLTLLLPNTL